MQMQLKYLIINQNELFTTAVALKPGENRFITNKNFYHHGMWWNI
jgi:hypothetical protein